MSVPVNITPATAIVVDTLPFTYDQDISEAPLGIGNTPCTGNPYNAVWFKFTPAAGVTFVYVSADWGPGADTATFSPAASVWTGTPGALTAYTIAQPVASTSEFCAALYGGFFFRLPVTPATSYYIQVTQDGAGLITTGAGLRVRVFEPQRVAAPSGSLVVPDDDDEFPSMVLSETTGEFLRAATFPAGEYADTNPGGYYCTVNGAINTGVAFFDSAFAQIAAVSFAPSSVKWIKSDRNGNFYICTFPTPFTVFTVHKYTQAGVLVWSKPLTAAFTATHGFAAVAQDGVRCYFGDTTANTPILVYNFTTDLQEGSLAVGVASERFVGLGDGTALANGRLVFVKWHTGTSVYRVVVYHPTTGAELASWVPSVSTFVNHSCYFDETSIMLWGYILGTTNNNAIMERVDLVNGGTISAARSIQVTQDSVTAGATPNNPNAISNSCPVFALTAELALPTPPVSTTEYIRCLRRFTLPFDRSLWVYLSRIEFLLQAGEGLAPESGQGDEPKILVRFSGDGGQTWGNFTALPMGDQGEYGLRTVMNRVGKLRNGVCEVVVSDPVYSYLLDCFVDGDVSVSG